MDNVFTPNHPASLYPAALGGTENNLKIIYFIVSFLGLNKWIMFLRPTIQLRSIRRRPGVFSCCNKIIK
jgi:hypothetical protein